MSVDELYKLKKDVSALENKVYQLCTPRTKLLAKRTGAEFSPYYHLAMAKGCSDRPMDDKESAKLYIETAKANTEGALLTQINALEDKIGE